MGQQKKRITEMKEKLNSRDFLKSEEDFKKEVITKCVTEKVIEVSLHRFVLCFLLVYLRGAVFRLYTCKFLLRCIYDFHLFLAFFCKFESENFMKYIKMA